MNTRARWTRRAFRRWLSEVADPDDGSLPTQRDIVVMLGIGHSSVERWFRELREAGDVKRTNRRGPTPLGDRGRPPAIWAFVGERDGRPEPSRPRLSREQQDLVLEWLPMVAGLVSRYRWRRDANLKADLTQAGVVGLIEAVLRRDESMSIAEFSGFARPYIRGAIREAYNATQAVVVPSTTRREMKASGARPPSVVNELPATRCAKRRAWVDVDLIRVAVDELGGREAAVVKLCGLGESTLEEAGDALGVTASGACRIRSKAYRTLAGREDLKTEYEVRIYA